jgi:hypothetical protein
MRIWLRKSLKHWELGKMGNHTSTRSRARTGARPSQTEESNVAERRTSTTRPPRAPTAQRAPRLPKPPSAAQRQTKATTQLLNALGGSDKAAATAIALEAINERLEWDSVLQQDLRQKYEALAALNPPKSKQAIGPEPVVRNPSALVGYNPAARLNPYVLDAAYEHDQLRRVLAPLSQQALREAVEAVQARNPESKPTSRTAKQKMIDYIMEHVAPGY